MLVRLVFSGLRWRIGKRRGSAPLAWMRVGEGVPDTGESADRARQRCERKAPVCCELAVCSVAGAREAGRASGPSSNFPAKVVPSWKTHVPQAKEPPLQ